MTVIFSANPGTPILAGDMLLSTDDPAAVPYGRFRLPSHPGGLAIPSEPLPRFAPIAMRRKTVIVNKHLAVGVAGLAAQGAGFVDALQAEFGDTPEFEYERLERFLGRRPAASVDQLGYLVIARAVDWSGVLSSNVGNPARFDSERFGGVVAIGSGSRSVAEEIGKIDRMQIGVTPQSRTGLPKLVSLGPVLTLMGSVYWKEVLSPDNVFEAWGGGYDLIYQDEDQAFRPLSDYTIFLRILDVDDPKAELRPVHVLKYERGRARSILASTFGDSFHVFGASDINARNVSANFEIDPEFNMNSSFHLTVIGVKQGEVIAGPLVQIDGKAPGDSPKQTVFTWFDDDRRLNLAFHADHDSWLKEQAMEFFHRHRRVWDRH